MSFKLVKRIIHTDRVEGVHKLILIILADYVNESNGNAAWPSVTTVAIQAGTSIRHTRRIMRELETEGILITTRQAGVKGTNKYVIDLGRTEDTLPKYSPGADTNVRGGADIYDTKGGHLRHVGADTHVLRIDKEQIKNNLDGAAPSGLAVPVSEEQKETATIVSDAAHADAGDAPRCQEHNNNDPRCAICYTWQQSQWKRSPL